MRATSFLQRWVRRFMPPSLVDADRDAKRRAKIVILFASTVFFCGPVYGGLYVALGMPRAAIGAFIVSGAMALAPPVLRKTGSTSLAANISIFGGWAAVVLIAAVSGGIAAPALDWFALIPFAALMLAGARAARGWTALTLVTVLVFVAFDALGLTPPSEASGVALRALRSVASVGLVALVAALAWAYETNKDTMLARLTEANVELGVARDAARKAHAAARLVLDSVSEGLLLGDRDGRVYGERSRATTELLREPRTRGSCGTRSPRRARRSRRTSSSRGPRSSTASCRSRSRWIRRRSAARSAAGSSRSPTSPSSAGRRSSDSSSSSPTSPRA